MEHREPEDALRRLEQASAAAERLIADAVRSVKPPPAGWQVPGDSGSERGADLPEAEALIKALHWIGQLVPPDLQQRLAEALRELLLALRALIDWYLERLEQRRAEPPEVQEIPIL